MPEPRVLVIGAGGRLGRELLHCLEARGIACAGTTRATVDLARADVEQAIAAEAEALGATALLNAAAWTAVDAAEADEAGARAVNAGGAAAVARVAARRGARALHVSTDYVFDGALRRPYLPEDPTGPLNAYGRTKLEGERRFLAALPEGLVVRTAWLFGRGGSGFPAAILRVLRERGEARVVEDEWGCPTFHGDLADGIVRLLDCPQARGLCHFVNSGVTSRFEQARALARLAGLDPDAVQPIGRAELGRAATRPAYSALDTARYTAWTGHTPAPWQDALERGLAATEDT